jgi:4-amino-4-deoxy-L-arabinose transferase-like glycosyltransferase
MPTTRLGWARLGAVLALAALTLGVGLGRAGRLTYHEAFVAQAAREMRASGDLVTPTVGGRPWLEKPPLAIWLAALTGRLAGGVDAAAARAPAAVAAALLAAAVALFAARRFGPGVGLLAGLVQATTAWTVMRGRLAEADILLACLVTWTLLAFDRLRASDAPAGTPQPEPATRPRIVRRLRAALDLPGLWRLATRHISRRGWRGLRVAGVESSRPRNALPPGHTGTPAIRGVEDSAPATHKQRKPSHEPCRVVRLWRWGFFAGLGLTSLAKGVGFGAALALAAVALVLLWDRDALAWRRLRFAPGWILTGILTLTWPLLVVVRHPSVVRLWALHVTDRLASHPEHFTSQNGWQYALGLLTQLLPWAPLALVGAWRALPQAFARRGRGGGDRLLFAWAVAPLALLMLATVRNAHYAIHALPPWSVWAALSLTRLGDRWQQRGWSRRRIRTATCGALAALGLAYALGFAWLGPRLDRRGVEWTFYQSAARQLRPGEPVALLYHVPDWDREPYETPFGPFPHDFAVRLFYLERPASCPSGLDELKREPAVAGGTGSFAVIGRDVDLPGLGQLGRVETLARGPSVRSDRTYLLYRVTPAPAAPPIASRNPLPHNR